MCRGDLFQALLAGLQLAGEVNELSQVSIVLDHGQDHGVILVLHVELLGVARAARTDSALTGLSLMNLLDICKNNCSGDSSLLVRESQAAQDESFGELLRDGGELLEERQVHRGIVVEDSHTGHLT